jgi:hypothetical protein
MEISCPDASVADPDLHPDPKDPHVVGLPGSDPLATNTDPASDASFIKQK